MRHTSLFAGADAVGIAVKVLGGETVAYSEFDPKTKKNKKGVERLVSGPDGEQYPQRLLKKRLPDAVALGDVTKIDWEWAPFAHVYSAGFPCQDLSGAGLGAGLDGDRSGLYVEVMRCIEQTHPELVLLENVPNLLSKGYERLLRDFDRLGYDCEWDVISAAAVGGHHLRERWWCFAYPRGESVQPRVFGAPKKISKLKLTDDHVKWPRAGLMMSGLVVELEPLAPRKTKRIDGKTYWVGVNLMGEQGESALVPTPTVQDAANHGGPAQLERRSLSLNAMAGQGLWPSPSVGDVGGSRTLPSGTTPGGARPDGKKAQVGLPNYVDRVESGEWENPTAMLPTPTRADGERMSETYVRGVDNPTLLGAARLLPTPAAQSYGSNQGGAAGRVGDVRYSLEQMARNGSLDEADSLSSLGDLGAQVSTADPLVALSGTTGSVGSAGSGEKPGLWPTPRSAWNENRGTKRSPSVTNGTHGAKLAEEVAETEVSEGRERGSLNPDWVEHLIGLPIGWTNIDCDAPVYQPFWDEPLPRVIKESPNRRQRLQLIGNSLVWLIPYLLMTRYQQRMGTLPGSGINMKAFE